MSERRTKEEDIESVKSNIKHFQNTVFYTKEDVTRMMRTAVYFDSRRGKYHRCEDTIPPDQEFIQQTREKLEKRLFGHRTYEDYEHKFEVLVEPNEEDPSKTWTEIEDDATEHDTTMIPKKDRDDATAEREEETEHAKMEIEEETKDSNEKETTSTTPDDIPATNPGKKDEEEGTTACSIFTDIPLPVDFLWDIEFWKHSAKKPSPETNAVTLSALQLKQLQDHFSDPSNNSALIQTIAGHNVTVETLNNLIPPRWLDDVIINSYMTLCSVHNERMRGKTQLIARYYGNVCWSPPKVKVLSSHYLLVSM